LPSGTLKVEWQKVEKQGRGDKEFSIVQYNSNLRDLQNLIPFSFPREGEVGGVGEVGGEESGMSLGRVAAEHSYQYRL